MQAARSRVLTSRSSNCSNTSCHRDFPGKQQDSYIRPSLEAESSPPGSLTSSAGSSAGRSGSPECTRTHIHPSIHHSQPAFVPAGTGQHGGFSRTPSPQQRSWTQARAFVDVKPAVDLFNRRGVSVVHGDGSPETPHQLAASVPTSTRHDVSTRQTPALVLDCCWAMRFNVSRLDGARLSGQRLAAPELTC